MIRIGALLDVSLDLVFKHVDETISPVNKGNELLTFFVEHFYGLGFRVTVASKKDLQNVSSVSTFGINCRVLVLILL